MLRLFVGIALPEEVQVRLGMLCSGLPNARWVRPENLHMTLRFIGEVGEDVAEDVDDSLQGIRAQSFSMSLSGLGFFGNGRSPRQVWVGVERNPLLLHLQEKIESAIVRAGLPPERRKFVPHVTLARLRGQNVARLQSFLSVHEPFREGPFAVDCFTLFSSKLSHNGSIYRAEADYLLSSDQAPKRERVLSTEST
ncbi:MAG: RNA 2',3'-cyclic phosphodiesterase [Alphaproteobacteria bacterium]|nr:RNA 2',3'-cyclic phosphodiesterase [Alphaproteobacteria bacterium]